MQCSTFISCSHRKALSFPSDTFQCTFSIQSFARGSESMPKHMNWFASDSLILFATFTITGPFYQSSYVRAVAKGLLSIPILHRF